MKNAVYLLKPSVMTKFLYVLILPIILNEVFDFKFSVARYCGLFIMYWFTTLRTGNQIPYATSEVEDCSDPQYVLVKMEDFYFFKNKTFHLALLRLARFFLFILAGCLVIYDVLVAIGYF